jgi:hypothetical protein
MDELNESIRAFFNQGSIFAGIIAVGITYIILLGIFFLREKRERRTK